MKDIQFEDKEVQNSISYRIKNQNNLFLQLFQAEKMYQIID